MALLTGANFDIDGASMLLAALFAIPVWLSIPTYFVMGIGWAVLYLPRAVALQARRYKAWKEVVTDGKSLAEALNTPPSKAEWHGYDCAANFASGWGQKDFSERKILTGFMFDIAFWPLRFLKFIVVDGLKLVLEYLTEYLADFWRVLMVPFFRWIWRGLRHLWTKVIAPAYRWVYQRVVRVYQAIIQRANREAIADMEILNSVPKEKN